MPASDFNAEEVKQVLNEASVHMGLPAIGAKLDSATAPSKRFSDDIVQIELSGPTQQHLSVVDVPGLFHNPTKFQTAEDKEVIRRIVKVCFCVPAGAVSCRWSWNSLVWPLRVSKFPESSYKLLTLSLL